MNATQRNNEKKFPIATMPPLARIAANLSALSMIWTTYSIIDLFHIKNSAPATGGFNDIWIGLTVALSADLVWGAIIYADYKGLALGGKSWTTATAGWIALAAVVSLVIWHGIAAHNIAMAVGGPILPLGAKVVWVFALIQMKGPSALTAKQRLEIAEVNRKGFFDAQKAEAERATKELAVDNDIKAKELETDAAIKHAELTHREEMRRITMAHEKEMARLQADANLKIEKARLQAEISLRETEADFDIEISRADKAKELRHRRPIVEISGELAAPEDTSLRKPLGRVPGPASHPAISSVPMTTSPAASDSRKVITLRLDQDDTLTQAEQYKRALAATWHLAKMETPELTQVQFCNRHKVNAPYLSKAIKRWPLDSFTDEELREAVTLDEACGS